jgi:hypothetical protein
MAHIVAFFNTYYGTPKLRDRRARRDSNLSVPSTHPKTTSVTRKFLNAAGFSRPLPGLGMLQLGRLSGFTQKMRLQM